MEKKNNNVKAGFSKVLWGVMAILLYAAPCDALTGPQTVPFSETLDLGTDYGPDNVGVDDGFVNIYGTLNMHPGAYVDWGIYTFNGSTVNIHAGEIGAGYFIMVVDGGTVTVYGTDFHVGTTDYDTPTSVPIPSGILEGTYGNGNPIYLWIMSDIPIYLAAPGGDSITVNIEKAKVCWHHSDIHVEGKLYLPQGFWMDNLEPVGSAVIKLADVEVANQSVGFEITGKKDDKWEYKDEENPYGNIKEFKIDWKYKEGFVKFKLVSAFDSVLFEGSESLPDELECVISLGDDMISGSDLIDAWTNKDDKHWDYKW